MDHMFIFGLGYTANRIAQQLRAAGWTVDATGRAGNMDFSDRAGISAALGRATHVLSSVPPGDAGDPVLAEFGDALRAFTGRGGWLGYLSSTGVYGDTGGAWVDETAPVGGGRRSARSHADALWLERSAHVFRLPGIYGPERSAMDRIMQGRARRIDLPGQVFSRIHVDDIVSGVLAALNTNTAPAGAYNLADNAPYSQNEVIEEGCRLLGQKPPPLLSIEDAGLSAMAREFYAENRRVANGKAKRILGWQPRYKDFRQGLAAIHRASRSSHTPSHRGTMTEPQITHIDHETHGEYRAAVAGSDHIGRMTWKKHGTARLVDHTLVPPEIGGRGIAAQLVEAIIADASAQGFKIIPQCSYVAAAFKRRPEWSDLLA